MASTVHRQIVQGETNALLSSMRRSGRWAGGRTPQDERRDPLLTGLYALREQLLKGNDVLGQLVDVVRPFCEVVMSEDTSGPITGLAIGALNKFLICDLISPNLPSAGQAIREVAEAITHAKFVGTSPASDEVVLMKILNVLNTLLSSPAGQLLSNETVCDVFQSCFRICFEWRLSELLRCHAESCLSEMVHLLFSELNTLKDEDLLPVLQSSECSGQEHQVIHSSIPMVPAQSNGGVKEEPVDAERKEPREEQQNEKIGEKEDQDDGVRLDKDEKEDNGPKEMEEEQTEGEQEKSPEGQEEEESGSAERNQFVSHRGVHFATPSGGSGPHNIGSVKEILKFFIAIINPSDKANVERVIGIGLTLLTVVMESGGRYLCQLRSLRRLLQNSLCRHLFMLLRHESHGIFSKSLRICFLLFEFCRTHLKLQFQWFLVYVVGLLGKETSSSLSSSSSRRLMARKEMLLEFLIQLSVLPGLIPEVFVNYDCSTFCINIMECLTKLLSKQACPPPSALLQTHHILVLDTLLSVVKALGISHRNRDRLGDNEKEKPLFTPSELLKNRQLKKLISAGTEQFNRSPKAGIAFLQEQGVLETPLNPEEVAHFLRSNPAINKQVLGEFFSSKKNLAVLEAFVRCFKFEGVNLVDSLRDFLESFRLSGEAPVISRIMELFAAYWLKSNQGGQGSLFHNQDAVYVLCYAIMMLNTDLHSARIKQRMCLDDFIVTRRGMNNGEDFPRAMLTEVYNNIQEREIILPSEHSGAVKESYEWKSMLSRSEKAEGVYYSVTSTIYHHDVFLLVWGPAAAALSSALDHWPVNDQLMKKIMAGFNVCASVAAQYELKDVFDKLIISLSNATTLLHPHNPGYTLCEVLAGDYRARLSLETMTKLIREHGNLLCEGWKNSLDCVLALFKDKLLPESLVKVEDFLADEGEISLYADKTPAVRPDHSLLSAFFYNYLLPASGDSDSILTPSEVKQRAATIKWIKDLGIDGVFAESKFLPDESLTEFTKALIFASRGPEVHQSLGTLFDEDAAVFFLEMLVATVLENKDRPAVIINEVCSHLSSVIHSNRPCRRLRERAIVAVLRLAMRLLHKDQVTPVLLHALQSLVLIPTPTGPSSDRCLHRQMAKGVVEVLHHQASHIGSSGGWSIVFPLMEVAGTGICLQPRHHQVTSSTSPSRTELAQVPESEDPLDNENSVDLAVSASWESRAVGEVPSQPSAFSINKFDILVEENLPQQDPESFFTMCEGLTYLVREQQCISPDNFTIAVKTVRLFTEVTSSRIALEYDEEILAPSHLAIPLAGQDEPTYGTAALRLLDLLDSLYSRTSSLFSQVKKGGVSMEEAGGPSHMWHTCWCPLLEGMARMCCDQRRQVRQAAISYLQRALLAHNLHSLTASDWEACFLEVFFPMLTRLLEEGEAARMEEGQMRACNLLCKVFLQHLPLLASLATFTDLWVGILDFMDKYLHIQGSEILPEAIPESLKNMLLVMVTQGVLEVSPLSPEQKEQSTNQLWVVTWNRVEQFLPGFLSELFPQLLPTPSLPASSPQSPPSPPVQEQPHPQTHSHINPSAEIPCNGNHELIATPSSKDTSPSSSPSPQSISPLSQSPGEEGSTYPIVIHPPLPTHPMVVPPISPPTVAPATTN